MMIQLDATGRPDESLALEFVGPLQPNSEENVRGKMLSFSLQKGHLRANACYLPLQSVNLEVISFYLILILFLFPFFLLEGRGLFFHFGSLSIKFLYLEVISESVEYNKPDTSFAT